MRTHNPILFFLRTLAILALLTASSGCGTEVRSIDSMRESTVRVLDFHPDGRELGGGSGFLVADQRHVATNYHVVSLGFEVDPSKLVFRIGPSNASHNELIEAKVVWSDKNADVSILELSKPLDRPVSLLALKPSVSLGDAVKAIGFPGRTDSVGYQDPRYYLPTLTDGTVSKMSRLAGAIRGGAEREGILHTATVTPGNSGGPLFDTCGRVIGVNTLTDVKHDAYNYAFHTEHLVAGLDSLSLSYATSSEACDPQASSAVLQLAANGAAIAIGLIALVTVMRSNGRKAVGQAVSRASDAVSRRIYSKPSRSVLQPRPDDAPEPAPARQLSPQLVGVAGEHAGESIPIDGSPIVLGRSASMANLIFSPACEGVSKRHCSIRFDAPRNAVVIEDLYSSFGTTLGNGTRLKGGVPHEVREATRFYIGSQSQAFEIRMTS